MAQKNCYPDVTEMVHGDIDAGLSFSLHRSIRSLFPAICSFIASIMILYAVEFGVAWLFGPSWRSRILYIGPYSLRWFALVPIGILLEMVRKFNDDIYIFDRERIVHHAGLLSLTYHVPSIRYYDIRAIQINQGIIGRILNFGDIELSTAAQDRAELVLTGVSAPGSLVAFIEEMRSWHREADTSNYHSAPRHSRTEFPKRPEHHPLP